MNEPALNVFIIDENAQQATTLRRDLEARFGEGITVTNFYTHDSCLEYLDERTHVVILGSFLKNPEHYTRKETELLDCIKRKNPKALVIVHASEADTKAAIAAYEHGANEYVVTNKRGWERITSFIEREISNPIRKYVREIGYAKFFGIFLLTFAVIGIIVAFFIMR